LSRERAVEAEYWLREYSVLAVVLLLALIGAFFLFFRLEPKTHRHEEFVTVQVTGIVATGDENVRLIVDVILPDGSARRMTTKSGVVFGGITDRACVEQRRQVETGKRLYRLAPLHNCPDEQRNPLNH